MRVKTNQFPVVVQAFNSNLDKPDEFVAEQVVYSQEAVDAFTARYTGKLIRQRALSAAELSKQPADVRKKRKASPVVGIVVLVLLLLVILAFVGFATGWIQEHWGIQL